MTAVEWFVNALYAYAAVGLVFACVFVSIGIGRVDPVALGSGLGFRLIVLPGSVALWPRLLLRWIRRGKKNDSTLAP
jgi:hypothetical protein